MLALVSQNHLAKTSQTNGKQMVGNDLLVKLYSLEEDSELLHRLSAQGIEIKRALSPDKGRILDYIRRTHTEGYENECDVCFSNSPVSCYIAVKEKQIIGFACYEATAKNFFGPTAVNDSFHGRGIGKALLLKSLLSMRELGYAYAIIGWVDDALGFFLKTVDAQIIPDSLPGVYGRMIDANVIFEIPDHHKQ